MRGNEVRLAVEDGGEPEGGGWAAGGGGGGGGRVVALHAAENEGWGVQGHALLCVWLCVRIGWVVR